ncbi:MAG: DNA double-strand break repair nuclease NurA [Anaerolineales bacterium]|nr:DNA double-strand break repair nuclease NurA [Anaerolineales bacterium]
MPIDFQQIYTKIRAIGQGAQARKQVLEHQRERAWKLLELHAADLDLLRAKVERVARDCDPNLRCALPVGEALNTRTPAPPPPTTAALVAVDGSQAAPDRHAPLVYALVNVGAVALKLNSTNAPQVFTESELLFDEELRQKDGSLMDEDAIALRRDARERAKLLELARKFEQPVVTLTDGPVELWGAKDPSSAGSYQNFLKKYLDDLDKLAALGVTLGGYVDKPAADLVVRLLEVGIATDEELKDARTLREHRPLLGATDLWLFGKLLHPGERSAVFAMQSSSRVRYSGKRALHFFYLNVARDGRPAIARVELPQWVAGEVQKLDLLHAVLIQQAALLGAKPYPYILHRAHETARVSFDEKKEVELLLSLELRKSGGEVGEKSGKQVAKDSSGKTKG